MKYFPPAINNACTGIALSIALLTAMPVFADSVELRIATLAPDGSVQMRELERAAAEIRDKTSRRVTLKFFPGGQQGDERDFIRKINLGQLDGAAVSAVGLSMIDESIRVLEAPGLFDSVEEFDYVADKMWPYFQRKFENKGFSLADRGEIGWVYFLTKDRVDSMAGLKAEKLWQWGDDALMRALYRKIGLSGVPLGMPEVDPSLTSGRITGCYGSPATAVSMQWYTKIRFMNSMPVNFGLAATVISQRALSRISADDRKAFEQVSAASAKKMRKLLRKANDDAKTTMTRRGVTIVPPSGSMERDFAKFAAATRQDLAGKMYSQSELDSVIKHRENFRAKRKPGPGT
jgi:TRAP-type C4-dicarboxylate transport system substrate-binding protein